MVDANCTCTGIPVNPCNEEKLVITFTLDDFGSQTTWELRSGDDQSVVAIGGPYADGQAGTTVMETVCVPYDCYRLRVMDSNGDGMGQGGYVVTDGAGHRIIDANGAFGNVSYLGYKFCLPVGTVELLPGSCDLENVTGNDNVQCTPVAGATVYDFQFFDPHTSYHPHFLRTQPMLGPNPNANIPSGLHLNLRVRAKVAGTFTPYGPACRISTAGTPELQLHNGANVRQAKGEFQAWPNPNNGDRLNLSLTGLGQAVRTADVTLYDATGRQVLSTTLPVDQGSLGNILDLGNTVSGVYLVRVTAGGTINESRILVVND